MANKKRKAKFKAGQVVRFVASGAVRYERIAYIGWVQGRIGLVTDYGHSSLLHKMRPLTKKERGQ